MNNFYLYTLTEDFQLQTPFKFDGDVIFEDAGKVWCVVRAGGLIEVRKGYSWNGCDIKFKAFGRIWGTPEGPIHPDYGYPRTYYASLIHDCLLQFFKRKEMPLTRDQIDLLFYLALKLNGFILADLYYLGVRVLGPIYSYRR